jgi:cytochrome c-type biogenesis protein CcmH/NrfF
MTYLPWVAPWVVFLLGMAWMIWQGTKAKQEYLRHRQAEKQETARATAPIAERVV